MCQNVRRHGRKHYRVDGNCVKGTRRRGRGRPLNVVELFRSGHSGKVTATVSSGTRDRGNNLS